MNDGLPHGHALPVRPVDFLFPPFRPGASGYVFRRLLDQCLRQVHHSAVVGIGLVELQHGEFRIPAPTQTLVAKVTVDLVDAIQPAHGQPLQIQLRRNPKVEVQVQRVVVGDKGPRHGPTRDRLHHGRFHFDEAMRIHETPHRLHQLAALQKDFAHLRIHHQIDIPLPVAQFHVGQTMPLLRQREQVFGQKSDCVHVHGKLAGFRAEQVTSDPDVIPQVEQSVKFEALVAYGIPPDVDLQALATLLQVRKSGLAHQPNRHNAPGDTNRHPRVFQLLGGLVGIAGENLRNGMSEIKPARIPFLSQRFNLFQFPAPQLVDLVVKCQRVPFCRSMGISARSAKVNSDYKQARREFRRLTPSGVRDRWPCLPPHPLPQHQAAGSRPRS